MSVKLVLQNSGANGSNMTNQAEVGPIMSQGRCGQACISNKNESAVPTRRRDVVYDECLPIRSSVKKNVGKRNAKSNRTCRVSDMVFGEEVPLIDASF